MQPATPQFACSQPSAQAPLDTARAPRMVIHLAVVPGRTLTWKLSAAAELRVHGARVWLTRIGSPYDYWLQPGDVLRLRRGERIWLSTDGLVPAEALLASSYVEPRGTLRRWLVRCSAPGFGGLPPRAR